MRRTLYVSWLCALVGCGPSSYGNFRDQLQQKSCNRQVRCRERGNSYGDPEKAVCQVQKQSGDSCAGSDECAFPLACSAAGKCERPARGQAGDPCGDNTICDDGLYCSPAGACADRKKSDEACDAPLAC